MTEINTIDDDDLHVAVFFSRGYFMPRWVEPLEAYSSSFVYVCIRLSVCWQNFSMLAE